MCYVKRGDTEITVYDSGEIEEGKFEIWDGSTVECPEFKNENNIWNWYIYKPSQLKFLADFVNDENKGGVSVPDDLRSMVTNAGYDADEITMTTDTTIYLMNNLDLGARQTNETKTTGTDWIPIGVAAANVTNKLGNFEGNNYTITGVYVNRDTAFCGIFGNSNTIQNLTIKNSYIKGGYIVGGIVGRLRSGKIYNCKNNNTMIIATSEELSTAGGIAGNLSKNCNIIECVNNGTVKGKGITYGGYVGGIVGYGNVSITISKCINNGSIEGINYVGGMIGYSDTLGTINECSNNGKIKGKNFVGGIIGYSDISSTINECSNNGRINGSSSVGGVIGYAHTSSSINECNNTESVEGNNCVGGIIGYAYDLTKIINCMNKANITSTAGVGANKEGIGGIAGHAAYIIKLCYNTGNVSGIGNSATGGICGRCVSGKGQDISLCYNSGEIKGDGSIGGISGAFGSDNADPPGKEYNCYNKGRLINTAGLNTIGGVAASVSVGANVTNCYYLSGVGANVGVYKVGDGGDLAAQNSEAKATDIDLKTFEEFLAWIEQQ